MYSKILVPLDGSSVAEQVVPYARFLATKLTLPMELLGVIDLASIAISVHSHNARYVSRLAAESRRASEAYLKRISETVPEVSITYSVETGKPEEIILERGAQDQRTLIAMATHGRSGLKRWLLGSVTEKVLRGTQNPLLLIRASEEAKSDGKAVLKTIIVPLDGSELAEKVLPHVTALAKAIPMEVVLLRAYALKQLISTYEDYIPDWDTLEAESKGEAIKYLDGKVRHLKGQGLVDVSSYPSEGEVAEAIIDSAKGAPNSLVVMGTHGRSGVKRWALGSVTEKVVRHCGKPVLVIRAT